MNPQFRIGMISGVILGGAIAAAAFLLTRTGPAPAVPPPPPPAESKSADLLAPLQEENRRLKEKLAELQAGTNVPPVPAKAAPKPEAEKPPADYKALFASLKDLGLAAFQNPKFRETADAVKAAGKPAIEHLMNVLKTSASATERFLAAALLEGAADPSSIDALAFALQGDKDDIVRRMASHALAVMANPSGEAPLRAAATGDADWGVRLNSAYGLAKLGKEDGLKILQDGYEAASTPAEYRLGILGGLADVAAPSTAPLFRKILADTKDATYVLMSIHALEKMKDVQSVPALQQVANSTQPDMVKQAAAKAIESIGK